ncbi:MAG: hypothetical protein ACOC84_08580 [Actinomycetota bacterium]
MSHPVSGEPGPDEFDDVPEDGLRQGAHRGHRPVVRVGARELTAIVLAGVLSLGVGAYAYLQGPDAADPPGTSAPAP